MAKFSGFSTSFSSIRGRSANLASYYISATGGTITTSGIYKYHAFTESGTFTVNKLGLDFGATNTIEVLVVAGGGGGGGYHPSLYTAGGGAGGVIYHPSYTISATNYTITVGAGGTGGGSSNGQVVTGGGGEHSSIILTSNSTTLFRAQGGGGGGGYNIAGVSGGSGGGAGPPGGYVTPGDPPSKAAGTSNQVSAGVNPSGCTTYGNAGSIGISYNWTSSGGGGGAGGAGDGPNAGTGIYIASFALFGDINNLGYFASGGSGTWDGQYYSPPYPKPGGGGGKPTGEAGTGTSVPNGTAGKANTGGGGAPSKDGGSGVVLIRYKYQKQY